MTKVIRHKAAIFCVIAAWIAAGCASEPLIADGCLDDSCDQSSAELVRGPEVLRCSRAADNLLVTCELLSHAGHPLQVSRVELEIRAADLGDTIATGVLVPAAPSLGVATPEGSVIVEARYQIDGEASTAVGAVLLDRLDDEAVLQPGDEEVMAVPVDMWPADIVALESSEIRFELPEKFTGAENTAPVAMVRGQRLLTFVPVIRNAVELQVTATVDEVRSSLTLEAPDVLVIDADGLHISSDDYLPLPYGGDVAVRCGFYAASSIVECEIPPENAHALGKVHVSLVHDGESITFTVSPRFGARVVLPAGFRPLHSTAEVEILGGVRGLPADRLFYLALPFSASGFAEASLPFELWTLDIVSEMPFTVIELDSYSLSFFPNHPAWHIYETRPIEFTLLGLEGWQRLVIAAPPGASVLDATIKTSLDGNSGSRVELYPGLWEVSLLGSISPLDSDPGV